jgi:predicted esterase
MTKQSFASRTLQFVVRAALFVSACAICASSFAQPQQQPTSAPAMSAPAPSPAQQAPPAVSAVAPETQIPPFAVGVAYGVSPTEADPQVTRFTATNLIVYKRDVARNAPLLVWFSGTGGTPMTGWLFIQAAAKAGYRVIGLMYDNGVSDPQTCGPNPDPACADRFRGTRIFGDSTSKDIDDLPAESVVNRLTKLLVYLDEHHHAEGWGQYLHNGAPVWSRIAVAGHSQGGGVAAYIAKKKSVYRVINLSGAWDRTDGTKQWAPWITSRSATPMNRWYAAYHAKESNAGAMKPAYVALKIPPDHIRVLTLEPNPAVKSPPGVDVYHGSMVSERSTPRDANGEPAYAPDWAFLLGQPQ